MTWQSHLRQHADLQKILYFLLIVSCAGQNYGILNESLQVEDVAKHSNHRLPESPETARIRKSYPLPTELLPGYLAYSSPFYLSPAIFLIRNSNFFMENYKPIEVPVDSPGLKPFETYNKEPGKLQSIPYHSLFSKYMRLRSGYLHGSNEQINNDKFEMEFKAQGPALPGTSRLPYTKQNSNNQLFGQIDNDKGTEDYKIPRIIPDEINRNLYEIEINEFREIPKNHKYSKLDATPNHVPFLNQNSRRFEKDTLINDGSTTDSRDAIETKNCFSGSVGEKKYKSRKTSRSNNPQRLHSVPYHPPFSKPRFLRAGYLDDTHQVIVIVKKTTSVVTKRFHV